MLLALRDFGATQLYHSSGVGGSFFLVGCHDNQVKSKVKTALAKELSLDWSHARLWRMEIILDRPEYIANPGEKQFIPTED